MALVNGNIKSFGLQPIQGKKLVLRFVPSSGAVGNQTVVTKEYPNTVEPSDSGDFQINLAATDNLRPDDVFYRIEAQWFNPTAEGGTYPVVDELPFELYVPSTGGQIGDLIRTPRDNRFISIDPVRPENVPDGTWWIDAEGTLWEKEGDVWIAKRQLELVTTDNVPYYVDIGTNLSYPRPNVGNRPVWWSSSAPFGYPDQMQGGDHFERYAPLSYALYVWDDFNRADGPAGSTPTGARPWTTSGATNGSAQVVGGMLRVIGHTSGNEFAVVDGGQTDSKIGSAEALIESGVMPPGRRLPSLWSRTRLGSVSRGDAGGVCGGRPLRSISRSPV